MTRSFRFQLAARVAGIMFLGLITVAVLGYAAIRWNLDREIDSTLLNLASIQAAAVTSAPSGRMELHEWELTPEEAASIRDLNRYAQVWTETGESLLRTRFITVDLPLDTTALRVAAQGQLVWNEGSFQGLALRSLYYPLGRMGEVHTPHVLQVAAPLATRNRMLDIASLFLLGVVLVVTAGTFAGSWWLANRAIAPVRAITAQATAIRAGSHHRILASADTHEYEQLIEVLNGMLARLDAAFEAQRQFTADASHELRSPLTALRGELELVRRRDRAPAEYRAVVDSALEEVERLCRVSDDLLTLARSDAGVMEPRLRQADLAELVSHTLERLRGRAEQSGIELRLHAPEQLRACFDPDLIGRVLWNLLDNAVKFSRPGGVVDVWLRAESDQALVEVADAGPGIPVEQIPRLFERFFRVDESRTTGAATSGTGLGLSIAMALVQLHGGEITVDNREGGGAVFRVRLPTLTSRLSVA